MDHKDGNGSALLKLKRRRQTNYEAFQLREIPPAEVQTCFVVGGERISATAKARIAHDMVAQTGKVGQKQLDASFIPNAKIILKLRSLLWDKKQSDLFQFAELIEQPPKTIF